MNPSIRDPAIQAVSDTMPTLTEEDARVIADAVLMAVQVQISDPIRSGIVLLQIDRDALFECDTIDGDPSTMTPETAVEVAEYDRVIGDLRRVVVND